MNEITDKDALDFWDNVYSDASPETNGRPSAVLKRFVQDRTPGAALDLGCAKGDDVVWLARQSWHVTGVDVSPSALRLAVANAERNGVTDHITFEQHDLATSFPAGTFDLVSAMFLQTPLAFPWAAVLRRAAASLRDGGLLLIATHQRLAPWSWGDRDARQPDANERLAELALDPANWQELFVGSINKRQATGPGGETAEVVDAVVALERR